MHLRNILKFLSASALMVVVMFAASYDVSAQKGHRKGHSKDRGDGGGNGNGHREKWKGEGRQDRGDDRRNQQQQQQVWVLRQPREQKNRDEGDGRRQQVWSAHQQQQQAQIDWNTRRQQENIRNQSRQEWTRKERRNNGGVTDNGYYGRRERDTRVRQVYAYPNQNASIWRGLWSGRQFDRRDDKRYLKEQKRAWKADLKSHRRYEKDTLRYSSESRRRSEDVNYDNNYYGDQTDNNYGYDDGTNWKEQILRVVIANVIGNRLGGDRRDTNSAYGRFYNENPYNNSYDRGGNYNQVPRFIQSYGTNYGDEYQPEYGDDVSQFGGNSITGGLLNSLPIAELLERYTGGNEFVSELIANFLAQGYDQGYVAGQSARRNRSGERYFQDPYVTEDGIYDPYSTSMGENRQILSEGYELGYQDALEGRNDYDPQDGGNVDLVSLLLGNVLGNM